MKEHIKKIIYISTILFIVISCISDEDAIISNKFIIHASEVRNFSNDQFIMATSPKTGEVFFWDIGTSFEDNVEFDIENTETIDLTFGLEFNTGFSITTYRDVKSGFKLSGFLFPCFEGEYGFDSLKIRDVELIIDGTQEIIEIVNPLYIPFEFPSDTISSIEVKNKIIYDYEKNITIIKGDLGSFIMDTQFTFLFSGEEDYKSITVKRLDWEKVDNKNYKIEIQKENLKSSRLHEIDVGLNFDWTIDSEVLTKDGNRIRIARWSNYIETQRGNTIKLFLEEGIELEELTLELKRNNTAEGFHYQNKFNAFPSSISLKEFNNEVIEITPENYNISSSNNFELLKMVYNYRTSNFFGSWFIYSNSNSSLNFNLPKIISEYLNETVHMKVSLPNPDNCLIQTYSIPEEDFENYYQQTGINRQLPCLNFNSSYNSIEF